MIILVLKKESDYRFLPGNWSVVDSWTILHLIIEKYFSMLDFPVVYGIFPLVVGINNKSSVRFITELTHNKIYTIKK